MVARPEKLRVLPVDLERDGFLRLLLRELTGTLQDVIGLDEAAGFVSVVGQRMGDHINAQYRSALAVASLSREQVAEVLVDLKRRIQGDFYLIEESADRIVLGNRACPFGGMEKDRPALCMMTSNVFGSITAENLGYANISIDKAIARGDSECLVTVYLRPPDEGGRPGGQEYFRA